ncbi:MAG: patatin-like phospholipase family protein [Rubrivivax sp.]|nr:MAG: patatin-like phospholipase family protein [Rubrivivax sp.]
MRTTFYDIAYRCLIYRARAGLLITLAVVLTGCATRHPQPESKPPIVSEAPVVKPAPRLPKIGLALGGGAARGFAHIGVLQVLEEQGIKPDLVVGTSAGSLVATLYASGKTPVEMASLAMSLDESTITDWVFPGRSVLKGEALAKFVRGFTGGRQIEQMAVPLGIVATDLRNGQAILFRRGDPGTAVRASSSVPAVFEPVKIAGHEYVDGGLVSPVPVKYARAMGADLVIAVDISAIPEGQATKGAVDILLQTFNIMGHSISQYELQDADVVMKPKLMGVGGGDFGARRLSILAGREAALTVLQQLKEKIAAKTR